MREATPTVPGASLESNDAVFDEHERLMLEARTDAMRTRASVG